MCMVYLSFYLNLCPCSWSTLGYVQRLWSDLGRLKVSTLSCVSSWVSPRCRYFSRVWSASGSMSVQSLILGHWPSCTSRTSVPIPCSHPSRHCSFGGHCTKLNCSWPAQTPFQLSPELTNSVVCLKDLNQSYTCFFGFYLLARYWVPLSPIQPLMRAALNSFSVLFTLKLSCTISSHLMNSCSRQGSF